MAVREFTDSGGREWRVWDVVPESIHPPTKTEDYLADIYRTGWLVFETKAEDQKRRLSELPSGWSALPATGLEALLRRAEVIPRRTLPGAGEAVARPPQREGGRAGHLADVSPAGRSQAPREARPDISDLGVVRTFRYPGGRYWVVCVIRHPEGGGRPVLRFSAGARDIDLTAWPEDWADYPDDRLVELLRQAAPRRPAPPPPPGAPRRRWDDPRP
jgi:hypothetical protein